MTHRALFLVLVVAVTAVYAMPRPQDPSTNNIVPEAMNVEEGESLIASLILAVARDWDLGLEDTTEYIRAVPAMGVNGTTFGPTTHPLNQSSHISFTASNS